MLCGVADADRGDLLGPKLWDCGVRGIGLRIRDGKTPQNGGAPVGVNGRNVGAFVQGEDFKGLGLCGVQLRKVGAEAA
jgi:hypothetical protein